MTCLTSVSFSAQLCGSIPRLAIQATRAWGFFADKKTFVIKSACIPTSMILLRAMACLMRGQIWVAVFNFDRDTVEVLNLIFSVHPMIIIGDLFMLNISQFHQSKGSTKLF